jgi:hypothetical protein
MTLFQTALDLIAFVGLTIALSIIILMAFALATFAQMILTLVTQPSFLSLVLQTPALMTFALTIFALLSPDLMLHLEMTLGAITFVPTTFDL